MKSKNRTEITNIRVSPEEKALLVHATEVSQVGDVSDVVRDAALLFAQHILKVHDIEMTLDEAAQDYIKLVKEYANLSSFDIRRG